MPDKPRRILTLILGVLLILTSGLIGWIPGPGGMIPFLLGIAVLSTEFEWADRLRERLFQFGRDARDYLRKKPLLASTLTLVALGLFYLSIYIFIVK